MPLCELHHNECRNAKFWFHVFLANHLKLSQFGNNIWNLFGASIWDRTMKFIVCLYFIRRKKSRPRMSQVNCLIGVFGGKRLSAWKLRFDLKNGVENDIEFSNVIRTILDRRCVWICTYRTVGWYILVYANHHILPCPCCTCCTCGRRCSTLSYVRRCR